MLLEEFDYELPKELIAQRPLKERDASRMMLLDRAAQSFTDCQFRALPEILAPGDLLVVNNTRVFPARLLGRRRGTQAQAIGKGNPAAREYLTAEVELLLTRNESGDVWQGLVHPGRKIRTGEVLVFGGGELEAEVLGRGEYGVRRVLLRAREGSVASSIDRLGHVPLPPYVGRPDEAADRETYQTVYARVRGAVAAPTAGFHFTERVFDALRERKIETCEITLHVGPGTFRPVQTERVEDHKMESEQFEISEAAAAGHQQGPCGGTQGDRGGHHQRSHPGIGGAAERGENCTLPWRDRSVHRAGLSVPGGSRVTDQLPSAEIDPADAGLGVCRPRADQPSLSARYRRALPLLQLW